MSKVTITRISDIFVGRTTEMVVLEDLWESTRSDHEHKVHVLLNAPGTGKTVLLKRFGRRIEEQGRGICLDIACSSAFQTVAWFNKNLVKHVASSVMDKTSLVTTFVNRDERSRVLLKRFHRFEESIEELAGQDVISIAEVITMLQDLSSVIPVLFIADEIQELQGVTFQDDDPSRVETALHYFTRILKDLLRSNVMVLLSGTRYHLLSQIGEKIGSPLRGKVLPLTITRLEPGDIAAFVAEMEPLLSIEAPRVDQERSHLLFEQFQRFLEGFSGGHPRTVFTLAVLLVENARALRDDEHDGSYTAFVSYFLPRAKRVIPQLLLGSDHAAAISSLSTSRWFGTVKRWIVERGHDGYFLGLGPQDENGMLITNDTIHDIVYQLMNIGVIVQNGQQNYHLTSYFHLVAFVNQFQEPHDLFLRQVLDNHLFTLMCGGHAGLGYTFETIFASMLMSVDPSVVRERIKVPLDTTRLHAVVVIPGRPRWQDLSIEPGIVYRLPGARAVDMLVYQDGELCAIQATTSTSPSRDKITALIDEMDAIESCLAGTRGPSRVHAWLVSLFPLQFSFPTHPRLVITAGEDVAALLGKEMHARLHEVKMALSRGRVVPAASP